MNRFLIILFLTTFIFSEKANAQNSLTPEQAKVINLYVDFVNENIHGLLITQRIFDIMNRDINKYVDLSDVQTNSFTNMDVSENVFIDRDNMFYKKISPDSMYTILLKDNAILNINIGKPLINHATNMHTITFKLNSMRFEIEEMIKALDLKKRENISLVYDKLEEAVQLYYNFYEEQKGVEKIINEYRVSNDQKYSNFIAVSNQLYYDVIQILKDLHSKNDSDISGKIEKFKLSKNAYDNFSFAAYNNSKLMNASVQHSISNVKNNTSIMLKIVEDFNNFESLPEDYKLWDKYYYYYNVMMLGKMNRYGGIGLVDEMNNISSVLDKNLIKYLEMPHYLKIVYPKILQENTSLASSDPLIEKIPTSIKGRNVVIANRTIKVDSSVVEFNMYDHKIIDKDIVSISFNGDWIIEKYEISDKPYTFNIKLNDNGKNFLLLHADDMGRNPPATIALSYTVNGKKEVIILNSDTQKSELIEIVHTP